MKVEIRGLVAAGFFVAGCVTASNSTINFSVYDGVSADGSTGGFISRMTIGDDNFSTIFIKDDVPVAGDPGMGGALNVKDGKHYTYVSGIGLLIPKIGVTRFEAGLSICKVMTSTQGDRTTTCRLPNQALSNRSVITRDGRLLEFNAACATPTTCSYTLARGSGRFDWLATSRH